MSDWYEAVAVSDVHSDAAQSVADVVIARFVADGIVLPSLDPDAALGGPAHRPGPKIPQLYQLADNECEYWTLLTNGVEVCVGPWINQFGFTVFDGFTCPSCSAEFPLDDDAIADPFSRAIGSFLEGGKPLDVCCTKCGASNTANRWTTKPHMGFTNLAFQFWNWPSFDSDSWRVDIPALIKTVADRDVVVTYGRI